MMVSIKIPGRAIIVDAVERKVESQVQFWSLLGPFLVLLSIAVLLFKVSIHWYFPVSALIGIPLCVKWKMKGMAVALCTLLFLTGLGYQNLDLEDRYWHVGLSLAMAFSFIVLTLSLEEAQGLIAKLERESQSRLDNFVLLDEKLKSAEKEWTEEREKAKAETSAMSIEVTKALEEKNTFHKLAQLAKEELIHIRNQHDQLLQDLHYKKQQIAQLHERLEGTELSLQEFINSDTERKVTQLTDELAALEREKEVSKAKINLLQNDAEKLKSRLSFLEEERNGHQQTMTGLQQQCEQMRHTEAQQRQLLQQAQQKVHELKIQLMEGEQQSEALEHARSQLSRACKDLEMQKEQCCRLAEDLKASENQACQAKHKIQELECLKTQLEEVLRSTQDELQQVKQKKEQMETRCENLPYATGNTREIESMYLQLKAQFQEKCLVLDEARRELFRTNEAILTLQKEREEELFEEPTGEKLLRKDLIGLGHQFDQLHSRYQQENDALTDLVKHLFGELCKQVKS